VERVAIVEFMTLFISTIVLENLQTQGFGVNPLPPRLVFLKKPILGYRKGHDSSRDDLL